MKIFWLALSLIVCFQVFADEVKIEINPTKPVKGEVFRAYFRIFTDSQEEPVVNFIPSSLEVVDKSNQGTSTRTMYANGNFTVTREITLVYDLVANKAGTASLREINVQVGSKTIRHPSVSLTVLNEPEEKSNIFVLADVAKREVFVGEGVLVRYYVYSKVAVKGIEIKKFPGLNHFLKRFLQEPENPERVNYDGEVFVRRLVYSAKLFPEKTGELKIDPLFASVTFAEINNNDPFGSFGFSRDFKTRSLHSEPVVLMVKPLPPPVPPHFTGLIGKHDFDLQVGQKKLIVNEPLEIKLTVSGGGMLEGLEAPALITHPGFEEFETNGDLKISDANLATKTFDYTYLAKEDLKIPESSVTLSYFDTESMRYITTQLPMPELVVAGGSAARKDSPPPENEKKTDEKKSDLPAKITDFSGPLLADPLRYREFLPYVNFLLAIGSLVIALSFFVKSKAFTRRASADVPAHFKRGNFSFGEFTRWLSPLIQRTGKPPVAIIKDSTLEDDAKAYFIELLNANDYKDYAIRKTAMQFKYNPAYFKSLGKYIKSAENESTPKPS